MGKECPKCGMTSDRDDLCTWCNADLRPPQKKPASPDAKGALPSRTGPAPGQPGKAAAPGPAAARSTRGRAAANSQPSAPERPGWMVPAIILAGVLVATVVGLLVVGVMASGPPADPGKEWKELTSNDKSFTAWYPEGWGEPSNAGSGGTFVRVKWSGSKLCEVIVRGSSGAGSVGDMAAAKERVASANLGPGEQLPVSQTADGAMLEHFKNKEWLAAHADYKEAEAKFDFTFSKARAAMTEYTFTKRVGLLPVKMRGVRWATQQGDYAYHVTAEAPEKHWAAFEPVAKKIVGGVTLGAGGGT